MHDSEYYCRDCGETFDTEPPYHNEVKVCPFCESRDIISESQHQMDVHANANEEQAEEFRIIKGRKW